MYVRYSERRKQIDYTLPHVHQGISVMLEPSIQYAMSAQIKKLDHSPGVALEKGGDGFVFVVNKDIAAYR